MYESIKDFIAVVGFPIFVAVYLLTRLENKLELIWTEFRQTNLILLVLVKSMDLDKSTIPEEILSQVQDNLANEIEGDE